MGNQFGEAGKSTRDTGNRKFNVDLKFGIFIFIMAVILVLMIFFYKQLGLGWLLVLGLAIIFFWLPGLLQRSFKRRRKEQEQYWRGAKAEKQVGELLSKLGNDFVVMRDIKSPYGNIGHVVYDKRGNIFVIETKAHGGKVKPWGDQLLVDDHAFEKDIVGQCQKNAIWIRKKVEGRLHLNAWITAVLVFTNAYVEIGNPIKCVNYMNKDFLLPFIQRTNAGSPAGVKLWETKGKEGPGNGPGG